MNTFVSLLHAVGDAKSRDVFVGAIANHYLFMRVNKKSSKAEPTKRLGRPRSYRGSRSAGQLHVDLPEPCMICTGNYYNAQYFCN